MDPLRKPSWLKRNVGYGATFRSVYSVLESSRLHTVCAEALCPNRGECFSQGVATFLILGNRCTRNCRFCAVSHGPAESPDPGEPLRVAEAVQSLGLRYVVVTSVTRDDLPDGGAEQFAETVRRIRALCPQTRIELLIPDFLGSEDAVRTVAAAGPDVLAHNLETVPRLYPEVRPGADYRRSLEILAQAGKMDPNLVTKSGMMLGMGETVEEIRAVLSDLLAAGCSILSLGQYLRPGPQQRPVMHFVHPEQFAAWKKTALEMGFRSAECGPFSRSSYHAGELFAFASADS